jgi:hypothetical protein
MERLASMLCAFASQKTHVRVSQAFYEQVSDAASHSRVAGGDATFCGT